MTSEAAETPTLAAKIQTLYEIIWPGSDRSLKSIDEEVAAAVRNLGGSMSGFYVWQLRTGRKTNPSKDVLEWLAAVLNVDPAYFLDRRQSSLIHQDLQLLQLARDLKVDKVATRLAGLPDHSRIQFGEILAKAVDALERQALEEQGNSPSDRDPRHTTA
jgi:transcriptional regulator with XRE-family HTH domain